MRFSPLVCVDLYHGCAGDLLYAEFFNGHDPSTWWMPAQKANFYELYNVTEDYYMVHGVCYNGSRL